MRTFLVAIASTVLLLPAAGRVTLAQAPAQNGGDVSVPALTGNAEAGKAVYALGNTSCRNCHGDDAQGAFAPVLAGRNFEFARTLKYIRNPIGRMPGYVARELSDQEIADLTAYWNSLPKPEKPAEWRTKLPEGAPRGQQLAISTIGCGQCHGATLTTPRHGAAEVNGDFEWFKRMVYDHSTTQREQWSQLDPSVPPITPQPAGPPGRVRMGNYSRTRLPEATLQEIWNWMNDLGPIVDLVGRMDAGKADGNGTTYTLNVTNSSVKGKGLVAEGVTVAVPVPAGMKVVNATGTGYKGVQGDAAVWEVARMAPTDRQTFTLTLAGPAPAMPVRGTIKWEKPAVKSDGVANFVAQRGRGATN
jgi:mono/diheme cytochrome c family protein